MLFVVQETKIILFSNVLVFYIFLDLMLERSPLISSGSNDLASFVSKFCSRVESGRTQSGNPILFSLSHLNMKTKSNSERSETKTKTNLWDIERLRNELIRSGTCRTRSDYKKANRKHRPVTQSHNQSTTHTAMHRHDNQPAQVSSESAR
jgi:hypothetical protein